MFRSGRAQAEGGETWVAVSLTWNNRFMSPDTDPANASDEELAVTEKTRLKRFPEQGSFLRQDLHSILDAGFICHLGWNAAWGPMVLPTSYGRLDDQLFLHGSVASRSLRAARETVPMCVTVTHVDGLVLARSVFEHAVNYRCAMVYGTPRIVTDPDEKLAGLKAISDQIAPGQWGYAREPAKEELAVTTVLVMDLEEASVKIRLGPPDDGDGPDADRAIWVGEIPLRMVRTAPVADPTMVPATPFPDHLQPGASRVAGGLPEWPVTG